MGGEPSSVPASPDRSGLVSVVIPAYNAQYFIAAAVTSVLRQTYAHLEVIVINDGSSDRTVEVARAIDDPRLVVITQPNGGVASARNRGISVSRGEFVATLDHDDAWLPQKLERQLELLRGRPDVVAVGCLMRYTATGGRALGTTTFVRLDDAAMTQVRAGRLMPFPISSMVARRSALDAAGPFDEALDRHVPGQVEDLDLVARLARVGRLDVVSEVLGSYRVHATSASARNLASQRVGTRFVRARLAARETGSDLTWSAFEATYRATARQRYGDLVQSLYRRAALAAAEQRRVRLVAFGTLAVLLGPRYSLGRARRQRARLLS